MATSLPQIPSIVTRWSADDITGLSNNASVTGWVDSVGGAVAVATGTAPLYTTNRLNGLPSVKFPGTAYLKAGRPTALVAALDSQICSVLMVFRTLGSVGNGCLFGATVGSDSQFWQATGVNVGRFQPMLVPHSGQTNFTTLLTTSVKPYTLGSGGGLERLCVNGGAVFNQTSQMPTTGGNVIAIGSRSDSALKVNAEIFDIVVWSVALTVPETLQAYMWAADKYNQPYSWQNIPSVVVYDGDSITAGVGIGGAITNCYPYRSAQSLGLQYGQWHNVGIGGITAANNNVKAPIDVDQFSSITSKYIKLAFFEWYNQRALGDPASANTTYAYCDARKLIPKTQLVLGTSTDTSATTDVLRAAYNTNLDLNHALHSDAYIPIHSSTIIGTEDAYAINSGIYFSTDGVHLGPSGYVVLADLFTPGIQSLPTVYSISGGSSSITSGLTTLPFTLSLSTAATAGQTITLTASSGTITVTAAGATITGNNSGSVQVSMSNGMFTFTFTYTGSTVGNQTITYTNGQSWANPSSSSITITSSGASSYDPGDCVFIVNRVNTNSQQVLGDAVIRSAFVGTLGQVLSTNRRYGANADGIYAKYHKRIHTDQFPTRENPNG